MRVISSRTIIEYSLLLTLGCVIAQASTIQSVTPDPVEDQRNTPSGWDYFVTSFGTSGADKAHYRQEITAGMDGTLAGFDLWASSSGRPETSVRVGRSDGAGQLVGEWLLDVNWSWVNGLNHFDVLDAGISLSTSDMFVIDVETIYAKEKIDKEWHTMSIAVLGDYNTRAWSPSYSGGGMYRSTGRDGTPQFQNYNQQLQFVTYMQPLPEDPGGAVPEPASMGLMGGALAGISLLARRFKHTR